MSEKHLKSHQYYSDLYDRGTVEQCRRTEKNCDEMSLPEDKKFKKAELENMRAYVKRLYLYAQTGERYQKKSETIRAWMDADTKLDELLEHAQPPDDIRCLTCRNRVVPTFKELWHGDEKENRVLFMFDCPNKCLPRRAFFNDGEEWRPEPRLCPHCMTKLTITDTDAGIKSVTTLSCAKCGYVKTEEYEWQHKKEEPIDEHFAEDRDRFCLTPEKGAEYADSKWRMEGLAKLGEEFKEKEKLRAEKLLENPKGFHLEGRGYTCFICHDSTPEGDNWYDKWGIKCLVCQNAIDKGEIPASLAKNKESWYTKYDFESAFNVKSPTLRKWVKEGVLKSRTISHYGKGVHYELYLIKDNKDFLPPKKLIESHPVSEEKDGKIWSHQEPWYKFVDPFEHLKGYKIMNYMRLVPPEEMAERKAEEDRKWEEKRARRESRKKIPRKVRRKSSKP